MANSESNIFVEARNLGKQVSTREGVLTILDDINFGIDAGTSIAILGASGSGKTTLLQSFLAELEDDVVYAVVSQTQLTATQFLQAVLTEFGFKPFDKRKVELLDMLNMFLIEQYSNGKKVVLIVDEAQNLSKKVLEEIRLLSGIETHKEKVLRIILAGQPELKDTLESPSLQQLVQRVRLRFLVGRVRSGVTWRRDFHVTRIGRSRNLRDRRVDLCLGVDVRAVRLLR